MNQLPGHENPHDRHMDLAGAQCRFAQRGKIAILVRQGGVGQGDAPIDPKRAIILNNPPFIT